MLLLVIRDLVLNVKSPSWETDGVLADQELSLLVWNQGVHYIVLRSPPIYTFNHFNAVTNCRLSILMSDWT
jgi:hypothetical protein